MKKINSNKVKYTRIAIRLLFFIFFPGAFSGAFAGVKYIFNQLGAVSIIEISSFVEILIALSVFTFLFGRFFCGYACAFGTMGDAVRALYVFICKKIKKKPFRIPDKIEKKLYIIKYIILVAIIVMCFTGVYAKTRGYSPWDVFSMIHAGNFNLSGYILGIILLLMILVFMCLEERAFCKFLCPMGAIFSMLPVLPFFSVVRDRENCIANCKACTNVCPSRIELPKSGKFEINSECFQCQKCIERCPKKNIHTGIKKLNGNEIWLTILKSVILAGLMIYLGL